MSKQPNDMPKNMTDEFINQMGEDMENLVNDNDAPIKDAGWFGRLKNKASDIAGKAQDVLNGFVLYRMGKEVFASVGVEELERGTAKIIRGLIWKIFDKYFRPEEGTRLYDFRHDDSKFWKTARTCFISLVFGILATAMLRQAGICSEQGDEERAKKFDFVGRACIKAIYLEAGAAINVDAAIEGVLNYVVGMLPGISDELKEAEKAVEQQAEEASKARPANVKIVPPRGSGKGMAA